MTQDKVPPAPETWPPARRMALRVLLPLDRFLQVEATSGIVLLIAAVLALAWANSPWSHAYESLWHTPVTLGFGRHVFTRDVHFFINEGLMAVFFFSVGLEIRREMYEGQLKELKQAVLPLAAAAGGMAVPALIYASLNTAAADRRGVGIPTATDIAFAVGVLALLGKRVPPALRILLLTLAIIDDIGAVLVIAIFYSSGIAWMGLWIAAAGVLGVIAFQRFEFRRPVSYLIPGVVVWYGMFRAGVHPAMAGVILGLLTPVRPWFGNAGFMASARNAIDEFQKRARSDDRTTDDLAAPLRQLKRAHREALAPVVRIQQHLHRWVAYGIMPLFAFSNAGVKLGGLTLDDASARTIVAGVALGLLVGKPVGVMTVSFAAIRLGLATPPAGVHWRGILLVGLVAGIGFTMSIFMSGLAFSDPAKLDAAKLGVLCGTFCAATAAILVGRILLRPSA